MIVLQYDLSRLDDSLSSSEEEFGADEDEKSDADSGVLLNGDEDGVPNGHTNGIEEDIPLSDIDSLASEERGDIVPHQRLTINNTAALLKAHKSMALPISTLPFSEHQSLTVPEPVSIPDIDDDLNRELAFYAQSLAAANKARALLAKEGVPFTRPTDYFAEMVKSDEHMGRVKDKLVDAAASRRAAAEARRQRDLKKFGKQVQVAKAQERAKEKRDTLDKINLLKRSKISVTVYRICVPHAAFANFRFCAPFRKKRPGSYQRSGGRPVRRRPRRRSCHNSARPALRQTAFRINWYQPELETAKEGPKVRLWRQETAREEWRRRFQRRYAFISWQKDEGRYTT